MRIIPPLYTWNKGIFKLVNGKLWHKPWLLGVILMICVVVAMLLANIPQTSHHYHSILETNIQLHLFSDDGNLDFLFPRDMTVEKFINDILMVLFFFLVGLEIKREFAKGALSTAKKAMLPIVAAFGGVIAPALIYTLINSGTAAEGGWGIPTATDIAFAVCIISMLGKRVPLSLKVFLTALAVTDDLIAILVVILFYGGKIDLGLLGLALAVIAFVFIMRRLGEKRMFPYILCTLLVSYRIEHALGPWVNFLIVPLFALANAGVTISDPSLFNIFRYDSGLGSVQMGVFFGLLIGKPLGIMLFSWLSVKLRIGDMPAGSSWGMLAAVACLGGIGFTMSIFIDTLSFGDQGEAVMLALRDAGKIAVLLGSLCSGLLGSLFIFLAGRRK